MEAVVTEQPDKRRWATVAVTLGLAFLSGHVMQFALSEREPVALRLERIEPGPVPRFPESSGGAALSAPPILSERTREIRRGTGDNIVNCEPRLVTAPAPAATLRIDLFAPCHPGAPVNVNQDAFLFATVADRNGRVTVRMPAFTKKPSVTLDLDGHRLEASLVVPDASNYRHVALLWDGDQILRINAYEFGATASKTGHVWQGASKTPSRASRGVGGFLTLLGDGSGMSAEVYSFPAGLAGSGLVRIVAEADVTERTCGRDIVADALQSGVSGKMVRTRVDLTMPDCDGTGRILSLQNLFRDMRLAGR